MKTLRLYLGLALVTAATLGVTGALDKPSESAEYRYFVASELEMEMPQAPLDETEEPTVDENGEPIPGAEAPFPEGELPLLFEHDGLPGGDAAVETVEPQPFIEI